MNENRESWGSRFGFIVATAGFAIGLGAIWRFPYQVGMNGGGAYILVYLILSILVGLPLFIAEISLGRKVKSNPIQGMRILTKKGSPWVAFGWLGLGAALFIMAYYNVLVGLLGIYFYKTITGSFHGMEMPFIEESYQAVSNNPVLMIAVTFGFLVLLCIIVNQGLKQGIEKACKILMPCLFVLLIVVAIRSCTLPGASAGLSWYLKPDFSKINMQTILSALPQVFFATGVGMAGAFMYGSYLDDGTSNVPSDSFLIIIINTLISIVAGLTIFPALFSFGMKPDVGPSLIFLTMPKLFGSMAGGSIFGGMFFFLVIVASISTEIGFLESLTATIVDMNHISRKKAAVISCGSIFLLNIPVALSYGPWKHILILNKNFFDLADYISGNIFLPWGGLVLSVFIIWKWGFTNFLSESNVGTKRFRIENWWKPVVTVFIPIVVAFVSIASVIKI